MSHMINPRDTPFLWRLLGLHEQQAQRNQGQTIKRLGERGGLDPEEALAILEDRPYRRMDLFDAVLGLAKLREEFAVGERGVGDE